MKELKLRQAVQGPVRRRQTFSLMLSLSLVQQCILPENWPFFRSRADDYTPQCLTHVNAFPRPYVNDFNYNKYFLGIYISRLVPLITQQQYILPRDFVWNLFSLANLVPKLSQDICLGKGPNRTLKMLRYSFHLFSAASWEIYKVPLKLMRQIPFLPPQTFDLLLGQSSLTSKRITVYPGIIDLDYKGENQIMMSSQILWQFKKGNKIAQPVLFTLHFY